MLFPHTAYYFRDKRFIFHDIWRKQNKTVYVKHIMWYLCTSAMRQINLIKMSSLDLYHIVSFSIMPLLLICMRLKFLLVDLKIFPGKKNLYLNSGDLRMWTLFTVLSFVLWIILSYWTLWRASENEKTIHVQESVWCWQLYTLGHSNCNKITQNQGKTGYNFVL